MAEKIRVENLVKIFGENPEKKALQMLQAGDSKDKIQEETGHVVGVAEVSFAVQEGEIFVVMGLSGSGKSTLIRCINRLITPTSGQVYIDDEEVSALSDKELRELRRTKLAMVFQHFALFPHKTVKENVAYGLKVRGIEAEERHERAMEALELVGLEGWADYRPENLSGGMQQRVGLARALATEAGILLMDEAFSALDPLIRREMQDELLELQERLQKTVLFITHDLNEALRVGNRIAVLQQDGRLVQIGTPVEIITEPANEYVAEFTRDVDQARVLTARSVMKPVDAFLFEPDSSSDSSIETALNQLEAEEVRGLYVVNDQQQPQGLLTKQQLTQAAGNNGVDIWSLIDEDFPRTNPTSTLIEIYELCAAGLPVAVVDKDNQLQGVIDPLDMLAQLGSKDINASEGKESNG